MPLELNGTFFPRFTADRIRYGPDDLACMQSTVGRPQSVQTSAERLADSLAKLVAVQIRAEATNAA